MRLNKRDLLMLWRFSTFNSVREVAQNPDILKLIFTELEPMFQKSVTYRAYGRMPCVCRCAGRLGGVGRGRNAYGAFIHKYLSRDTKLCCDGVPPW